MHFLSVVSLLRKTQFNFKKINTSEPPHLMLTPLQLDGISQRVRKEYNRSESQTSLSYD